MILNGLNGSIFAIFTARRQELIRTPGNRWEGVTDSGENHPHFGWMRLQIRVDLGLRFGRELQNSGEYGW